MAKHAAIGGSSMHLWKCGAAYRMTKDLPRTPSGPAAAIGTELHGTLEACLLGADLEAELTKCRLATEFHKTAMRQAVQDVREEIDTLSAGDHLATLIWPEARLRIARGLGFAQGSEADESCWGTADLVAFNTATKELLVLDLKTGGIPVSADSPQLALYGAGAQLLAPDAKSVTYAIVQFGQPIDKRTLTLEQARREWDTLADRLRKMLSGGGQFEPGDACTWCPARGICRANADHLIGDLVADAVLDRLSTDALAGYVARAKAIENFLDAARKELTSRFIGGEPVDPRLKFVTGITRRAWSDEQAVIQQLRGADVLDVGAPRKPLSPAKIFDLLPALREQLTGYVTKPVGSPTLVSASDRRKPVGTPSGDLARFLDDVSDVNFDNS